MHADFLNRQIANKHYIGAIEEHVVDQNVQLNRILALLEQEEFDLRKRLSQYRSKSRRRIRPCQTYRPYQPPSFDYQYSGVEVNLLYMSLGSSQVKFIVSISLKGKWTSW